MKFICPKTKREFISVAKQSISNIHSWVLQCMQIMTGKTFFIFLFSTLKSKYIDVVWRYVGGEFIFMFVCLFVDL